MDDPLAKGAADNTQIVMLVFIDASSHSTPAAFHFDVAMHIAAILSQFGPRPGSFDDGCDPIAILWIDKADFEMCIVICFDLAEATSDQPQPLACFDAQRAHHHWRF